MDSNKAKIVINLSPSNEKVTLPKIGLLSFVNKCLPSTTDSVLLFLESLQGGHHEGFRT